MTQLSSEKSIIFFASIAALAAISVCIYFAMVGSEISVRSWEIIRQDQQSAIAKGDWQNAERLGIKCVTMAQGIGINDFRIAVSLGDLGDVLLIQDKNKEAIDTLKRAVDFEKPFSSDTTNGADIFSQSSLGHIYFQLGRAENKLNEPKKAASYFKKSAAAFDTVRKNKATKKDLFNQQELVRTVIEQAKTAVALNHSAEALKFYKKALTLAGECFYPSQELAVLQKDYEKYAKEQNETADSTCSQSNWAQQILDAQKALDTGNDREYRRRLNESVTGCEGIKSRQILALISLRKLAKFYVARSKINEAIETCQKGLSIWRAMGDGGDSEADTLFTIYLRSVSDPRQRASLLRSHLELRIKLYGADDYHVAETCTRIAIVAKSVGDRGTAKAFADRSYDIYTKSRLKRRGVGTDLIDLGNLFEEFGEYSKAEEIYERTLKVWSANPNKHIAFRIDILNRLHRVYEKLDMRIQMNQVDEQRMQLEQLQSGL